MRCALRPALLLLLAWLAAAPSSAVESGLDLGAYDILTPELSEQEYKSLVARAEKGETLALDLAFFAALMGYGTQVDLLAARAWLTKARIAGTPLGKLYFARNLDGFWLDPIIPADPAKARDFASLAEAELKPWIDRSAGALFFYGVCRECAGDGEGAAAAYRKAAARGFVKAQRELAACYDRGFGVPQDPAIALDFFKGAADRGQYDACTSLGTLYLTGRGTPKDASRAVKWYTEAAEHGEPFAQMNLGIIYDSGEFLPRDDALAAKWYEKAASQGLARAQNNLALMFQDGRTGTVNNVQAAKWLRAAAQQGYASAQNNLAALYYAGVGVQADDALAFEWWEKAATQGLRVAQGNLALMASENRLTQEQLSRAMPHINLAAEQGDRKALDALRRAGQPLPTKVLAPVTAAAVVQPPLQLVEIPEHPEVLPHEQQVALAARLEAMQASDPGTAEQNIRRAMEIYNRMVAAGNADAMYNLGMVYRDGRPGVSKDDAQAFSLFRQAANLKHVGGANRLGLCYFYGRGTLPDDPKAVAWFRVAAEAEHAEAQHNLAQMIAAGRGVPKNLHEAAQWEMRSARAGYAPAQAALADLYAAGKGVEQNDEKARAWRERAANAGPTERGRE